MKCDNCGEFLYGHGHTPTNHKCAPMWKFKIHGDTSGHMRSYRDGGAVAEEVAQRNFDGNCDSMHISVRLADGSGKWQTFEIKVEMEPTFHAKESSITMLCEVCGKNQGYDESAHITYNDDDEGIWICRECEEEANSEAAIAHAEHDSIQFGLGGRL